MVCERQRAPSTTALTLLDSDRVQQSALQLIPPNREGSAFYYRVGSVILHRSNSPLAEEWMLCTAVDLLNKGKDTISTLDGRVELAALNLSAGRREISRSAYTHAGHYLLAGIELLDVATRWDKQYDLCLELHTRAAEVARAYGDFFLSIKLVSELLANARSREDRLRASMVRVYILGTQENMDGAIRDCIGVLATLDVRLPPKPSAIRVLREYLR